MQPENEKMTVSEDEISSQSATENPQSAVRHLYVHIPFCAKLCPYCSFYVDTHFKNKNAQFLDALICELNLRAREFPLDFRTIYFGGGTPSSLSLSQIESLLTRLHEKIAVSETDQSGKLSSPREFTFEINPATVSLEKAKLLRALGVNRISMGVQSWNDATLKTLGRIHSAAQAERTYETLRAAGFENVSLDLMFGVPCQTRTEWQADLDKTIALAPEHISAYCLTYEEDTTFFKKLVNHEFTQNHDWDAALFEDAIDRLEAARFAHYEISNYAKPGCESLHNFAYWEGADYLGIGAGAFSTRGAARWQNIANTEIYTAQMLDGKSTVCFEEPLDDETKRKERIAFSLRTNRGIPRSLLANCAPQLEEMLALKLLTPLQNSSAKSNAFANDEPRFVLTRRGKLLADSVASAFM